MTKIDLAKNVTRFVVGAGVTKIVSGIVKHNTDPEKVTDIITITTASAALGMMVADKTQEYTDTKIDELVSWWYENIKKS